MCYVGKKKMVMPNGLSYEKIKEDVEKNLSNYKIDKSFYNLELQNANDMQLDTWQIINSEIKKYAVAEGSYGTTI